MFLQAAAAVHVFEKCRHKYNIQGLVSPYKGIKLEKGV